LHAAQVPVEQQIKSLTEAFGVGDQTARIGGTLAVDAFKRRRELEAKLAKSQEAEKALQREMEASGRAKRRAQLEADLTENKQLQHNCGKSWQRPRSSRGCSRRIPWKSSPDLSKNRRTAVGAARRRAKGQATD